MKWKYIYLIFGSFLLIVLQMVAIRLNYPHWKYICFIVLILSLCGIALVLYLRRMPKGSRPAEPLSLPPETPLDVLSCQCNRVCQQSARPLHSLLAQPLTAGFSSRYGSASRLWWKHNPARTVQQSIWALSPSRLLHPPISRPQTPRPAPSAPARSWHPSRRHGTRRSAASQRDITGLIGPHIREHTFLIVTGISH